MLRSCWNLHRVSRSAHESFLMARNIAAHSQTNRPSHLPWAWGNAFSYCTSSNTLGEQFAFIKGKDGAEIMKEPKLVNVRSADIYPNSSHRDGSIYKNSILQSIGHVTKRDETQLEPMKFSDPTNCFPDQQRVLSLR
ncbi:uncharacterized protein [Triticum aestivum]|uniref:uncharacterized protein n=1 Tax=Triticum aestivum TaxID=4565 RepID=UPI001D0156E4|nr:uncharacterized protein LOC123106523 [Triticum aestivum]